MNAELKYRRIVQAIAETPWAIHAAKLAIILDLVEYRAAGGQLTEEQVLERLAESDAEQERHRAELEAARARSTPAPATGPVVSVIPIYGVISPRATMMSALSGGGTSLDQVQQALKQAAADPQISGVLLDIDSPGGNVAQVPETAALIRDVRASKPVFAIANTFAASAAYHLASQADFISASPSSELGSIGVYAAHQDRSAMQEKLGVKTTLISAGKYKVEGNPFEALTEEARQALQSEVDGFYAMFVNDVARGRNTAVSTVRNGFGEGRMLNAQDAVDAGMADAVEPFDAALSRLLDRAGSGQGKAAIAATGTAGLQAAAMRQMARDLRQTHLSTDSELAAMTRTLRKATETSPERNPQQ